MKYNNNTIQSKNLSLVNSDKQRETVFNFIKNHPGQNSEEILTSCDIKITTTGRLTELEDNDLIFSRYVKSENGKKRKIYFCKNENIEYSSDLIKIKNKTKHPDYFLAQKIGSIFLSIQKEKFGEDEKRFVLDYFLQNFEKDDLKKVVEETESKLETVLSLKIEG